MKQPAYVVIGHVASDIVPGGYRSGGTVTYAAVTAQSLGLQAAVVTRAEPHFDFSMLTDRGILVASAASPETTVFENTYEGDHRIQYIRSVAEPIKAADIPEGWRTAPIIHLGPLAQEMDEEIVGAFPNSLIGVTPQGWMRRWDGNGRVWPTLWAGASALLPRADVLVLSEDDVGGDTHLIDEYVRHTRIVVVTNGWRGSTVYAEGRRRQVPPRPAREVDPTGAGDVFAAAYLVALHEGQDPFEAARFANCVASFSVEAPGIEAIPSRRETLDCLAQLPEL